ncbi:MAG: hypothetical protein WC708_15955 [Lentisphaeria bacterium]
MPVTPSALLHSGRWNLQLRLQRFAGSAAPVETVRLPFAPEAAPAGAEFAGARWEITCRLHAVPDRPDALDGVLACQVTEGHAQEVNAGIELAVTDWSTDSFLLLPAAAYNGNRYAVRHQQYPPIATEPGDLGPTAPTTITDVPRLEMDPATPSHLHLLTGDETTPGWGFFAPPARYAAILLTGQGGPHGNHGIVVTEEAGHGRAVLAVEAPGVRPAVYTMMNTRTESWDRGADLATGDRLEIRFRLLAFPASDVQALYDRFAEVRKDLTGPVTLRHSLPFSAAWTILEEKYNRHNWNPAGYYTVGVAADWEKGNPYADWQLGWVGGAMNTLPLLARGTPESRERALKTLEFLFTAGTAPSGLPYGIFHAGKPVSDHFKQRDSTRWVMVRKLGDALYFIFKHFDLLKKQDANWQPPAHWERQARTLADRLVELFARHGQLGQFLDWDTGEIRVGGSTAGAMVPAGLALAGQWFGEPRYAAAAAAIARHFIDRDLRAGVTTGGPGEILQSPDSESAFALLESLVVLFETTADRSWLPHAEAMAKQCLTWCASYDHRFPAASPFGRLDMRAAGSVWANVQNKHSAPGICTLSGDSLFKLWRATGNPLYLNQIQETAHNLPQYLSRADRPVGDLPPGFMCERVNFSDWEGRNNIGGSLFGSCWCEVSLLLTAVEIPGLYLQPDTGFLAVFDHVDAAVTARDAAGATLRVTNPTAFDAAVKVLVETAAEAAARPLGPNALFTCPVLEVKAGETRTMTLRRTAAGGRRW